jgi:hypothetical protein
MMTRLTGYPKAERKRYRGVAVIGISGFPNFFHPKELFK